MPIIQCIQTAINQGNLTQPFNALAVYNAIHNIHGCHHSLHTIQNFLPKHRKGNPSKTSVLFMRISSRPALYCVI